MLRVGLTGGIGSGKSTVADLFAARGVPVIDADVIAREQVMPGMSAYEEILRSFGTGVLDADRHIDRAWLRQRVFNDPTERSRLELILHPRIREEMRRRTQQMRAEYCLLVIPLLVEAGQRDLVDRVLVVDAREDVQIARVMARSGLSEDEARNILAAQAAREERLRVADDVIENNGGLAELERAVERLHRRYLELAAHAP